MQATSKGSDQTVRMRRLIWGFAGRIYHIVGNPMPRLNYDVASGSDIMSYSKTCQKRPISNLKYHKLVFTTYYRLMQVKSIAKCSKGNILQ